MFDGNPAHPDLPMLWQLAERLEITYFGTSAPYLLQCRKEGLVPREVADLSRLRGVGSTGAPLPAEGFRWVYDAVSPTVQLGSISGGTDVCSGFVGASPIVPVYAGEISCRMLGCAVEAYDDDRQPVIGSLGELVITQPMPSMPVGFWGDADGSRYRAAYFEDIPGVWRHGDWITITERGTCIITGRSDATLNRGGVRLGTAEFYTVVEALPEVADSLVVHLEDDEGGAGAAAAVRRARRGTRARRGAPAAHRDRAAYAALAAPCARHDPPGREPSRARCRARSSRCRSRRSCRARRSRTPPPRAHWPTPTRSTPSSASASRCDQKPVKTMFGRKDAVPP